MLPLAKSLILLISNKKLLLVLISVDNKFTFLKPSSLLLKKVTLVK